MTRSKRNSLIALVLGAIVFAAAAPAAAQVDKAQIRQHIEGLYEDPGFDKVVKWNVPVRYKMAGLTNPKETALFYQFIARLRVLSGLDIAEDTSSDGNSINLAFIFVRSEQAFVQAASLPNISVLFRYSSESEDQYRRRMIGSAKAGWLNHLRGGDKSIVHVANLVSTAPAPHETFAGLLYRVIYDNLVFAKRSDAVQPSILNRKGTQFTELSDFDIALLKAYYSPDIVYRMPLAAAIPILSDKVAAALAEGK